MAMGTGAGWCWGKEGGGLFVVPAVAFESSAGVSVAGGVFGGGRDLGETGAGDETGGGEVMNVVTSCERECHLLMSCR